MLPTTTTVVYGDEKLPFAASQRVPRVGQLSHRCVAAHGSALALPCARQAWAYGLRHPPSRGAAQPAATGLRFFARQVPRLANQLLRKLISAARPPAGRPGAPAGPQPAPASPRRWLCTAYRTYIRRPPSLERAPRRRAVRCCRSQVGPGSPGSWVRGVDPSSPLSRGLARPAQIGWPRRRRVRSIG